MEILDSFGSAKPRLLTRDEKAPLRVNPSTARSKGLGLLGVDLVSQVFFARDRGKEERGTTDRRTYSLFLCKIQDSPIYC